MTDSNDPQPPGWPPQEPQPPQPGQYQWPTAQPDQWPTAQPGYQQPLAGFQPLAGPPGYGPPGYGLPPGVPRRSQRTRNAILAVIAVFVIVGGIGAVLAGNKPASNSPASQPTSSPPAGSATSPAQAVNAWYQNGGKADMASVVKATGELATAGSSHNFSGLLQACSDVLAASTRLDAAGPIPYLPAEQWLAIAQAEYSTGAAECQAGVDSQNASIRNAAAAAFAQGNADLGKVAAVLSGIGV